MPITHHRLGFVDHVLDNWHANVFVDALRGSLKHRGFDVTACTSTDPAEGRAWAAKHHVPYFASALEMAEKVDAFLVLAPGNPEHHLQMCRQVFPLGKPTFVDKPFAPTLAIAREIFALADQHKTPVQTSSALRYSNVQSTAAGMGTILHMVVWNTGSSFAEYGIHAVEMIVSCMGADAQSVSRRGTDRFSQLLIDYPNGRTAVANVYCDTDTPYAASLTNAKETLYVPVDVETLYPNALTAMLDFLQSAKPAIPREQTLMIRRILDAAESPEARRHSVALRD